MTPESNLTTGGVMMIVGLFIIISFPMESLTVLSGADIAFFLLNKNN